MHALQSRHGDQHAHTASRSALSPCIGEPAHLSIPLALFVFACVRGAHLDDGPPVVDPFSRAIEGDVVQNKVGPVVAAREGGYPGQDGG